ncbi:MAG TPA: hypothetical protein VK980_06060, partial [Sphingomonas sp.]|nr:hypothetical protein [Sphingomonas sp.]
ILVFVFPGEGRGPVAITEVWAAALIQQRFPTGPRPSPGNSLASFGSDRADVAGILPRAKGHCHGDGSLLGALAYQPSARPAVDSRAAVAELVDAQR